MDQDFVPQTFFAGGPPSAKPKYHLPGETGSRTLCGLLIHFRWHTRRHPATCERCLKYQAQRREER